MSYALYQLHAYPAFIECKLISCMPFFNAVIMRLVGRMIMHLDCKLALSSCTLSCRQCCCCVLGLSAINACCGILFLTIKPFFT